MVCFMTLRKTFYLRNIIIDKYKTLLTSHINGVSVGLHNIIYPITIKNNNTIKDTILTIISISPLLPFFIFIPKYIKKLKVSYNKYYNQDRFKANIKNLYGWGI